MGAQLMMFRLAFLSLLAVVMIIGNSHAMWVEGTLSSELQKCLIPLEEVLPCMAFLEANGSSTPNRQCCGGLRQLLDDNVKCVCILLKEQNTSFHIHFNVILALVLPFRCSIPANVSRCIDVLNLSPDSPDGKTFKQYAGYIDNLPLGPEPHSSASPPNISDSSTTSDSTTCTGYWKCHQRLNIALIAGFLLSISLVAMLVVLLTYRKHELANEAIKKLRKEREEILSINSGGRRIQLFRGKEMKKATDNFCTGQLLGSGGFGRVYKGSLQDGTVVSVKVGKIGSSKSTVQLLNEVSILSQVNHRSLVRLLGCCVELKQPLLVYEFVSNGTLYDHIHAIKHGFLNWRQRLKIAHQAADGIAYLHSSVVPPIVHRDIKSSNILLDDKCNAKVSDFGLSRLVKPDVSHISTCAQGTIGYVDPEYYRSYQLTAKSDVYSFGVVLLELVTSQKVIDHKRGGGDHASLGVYVFHKLEEGRIMDAVDKKLTVGASQESLGVMKAICCLALSCLEEKKEDRPSMKDVVEEIEYMVNADASVA